MKKKEIQEDPSKIFNDSRWIWPESQHWDIHNSFALFRKNFFLSQKPRSAPLYITADQSYQLYINGIYVCRGPARGYQKSWPYDQIDVGPLLVKGKNLIAVRAYNPGFSNFQYLTQGFAGLLVAAKWGDFKLKSDSQWKARRQTGINGAAVPVSIQLFGQEHIDLRSEDPDWLKPEFDDSSWSEPVADFTSCPWNAMPWYSLEPRGIDQLEEKLIPFGKVIGQATGLNSIDYRTTRDIARTVYEEGLSHQPADNRTETLRWEATPEKTFQRVLIDFGKTVVGVVGFQVEGAQGGEIIDVLHVETIDPQTLTLDYFPGMLGRMAFAHRVVLSKGFYEHFFYHTMGFRYMTVTVRHVTSPLILKPLFRTTIYPLDIQGRFQCSDSSLNRIWETCTHTQRCCSIDAFVDTPYREQAQWWGDARVQAWNTFHLANNDDLLRRGIKSISMQKVPNGLTYGHAPTMSHFCILPDFSLIWILTLWDYYWQTGSTELCSKYEETILGILGYFREKTDPKLGLVRYDARYWLFLDWTEIHREGSPTILNLWLLEALQKLEILWTLTKRKTLAHDAQKWALRLRKALRPLINKEGLIRDGYDTKGKMSQETCVHSQTLAIITGLCPQLNARMIEKVLIPCVREPEKFKAKPSAYWITYIFTVLQNHGAEKVVLESIRKNWGKMAEHGTTWENFSPRRGDESFSHAWSAHPLYHLMQTIGGIRQNAPRWKKIIFQPFFEGEYGETIIPTPMGKIKSQWKKGKNNTVTVSLTLPKGVSALVRLPGKKDFLSHKSSKWIVTQE